MANESAKFMKNCFIGWTNTAGIHYAHDYDPEKVKQLNREEKFNLKKQGKLKRKMINMSMILPFTFVCDTCGQYNYTGKVFGLDFWFLQRSWDFFRGFFPGREWFFY